MSKPHEIQFWFLLVHDTAKSQGKLPETTQHSAVQPGALKKALALRGSMFLFLATSCSHICQTMSWKCSLKINVVSVCWYLNRKSHLFDIFVGETRIFILFQWRPRGFAPPFSAQSASTNDLSHAVSSPSALAQGRSADAPKQEAKDSKRQAPWNKFNMVNFEDLIEFLFRKKNILTHFISFSYCSCSCRTSMFPGFDMLSFFRRLVVRMAIQRPVLAVLLLAALWEYPVMELLRHPSFFWWIFHDFPSSRHS